MTAGRAGKRSCAGRGLPARVQRGGAVGRTPAARLVVGLRRRGRIARGDGARVAERVGLEDPDGGGARLARVGQRVVVDVRVERQAERELEALGRAAQGEQPVGVADEQPPAAVAERGLEDEVQPAREPRQRFGGRGRGRQQRVRGRDPALDLGELALGVGQEALEDVRLVLLGIDRGQVRVAQAEAGRGDVQRAQHRGVPSVGAQDERDAREPPFDALQQELVGGAERLGERLVAVAAADGTRLREPVAVEQRLAVRPDRQHLDLGARGEVAFEDHAVPGAARDAAVERARANGRGPRAAGTRLLDQLAPAGDAAVAHRAPVTRERGAVVAAQRQEDGFELDAEPAVGRAPDRVGPRLVAGGIGGDQAAEGVLVARVDEDDVVQTGGKRPGRGQRHGRRRSVRAELDQRGRAVRRLRDRQQGAVARERERDRVGRRIERDGGVEGDELVRRVVPFERGEAARGRVLDPPRDERAVEPPHLVRRARRTRPAHRRDRRPARADRRAARAPSAARAAHGPSAGRRPAGRRTPPRRATGRRRRRAR